LLSLAMTITLSFFTVMTHLAFSILRYLQTGNLQKCKDFRINS
jgi:hypothetical protein